MKIYGTEVKGPLIIDKVSTLSAYTSADEGRLVYAEDVKKIYYGNNTAWNVWAKDVSDTAYGTSWDGVTDVAPSKNAVYDQMELMAPKANPTFTGVVSASEQPLFVAYLTSTQSNVTGDGTAYNITGEIWTEQIDVGGCFSDGVFTAPVAGLYLFSGDVSLSEANAPDLVMTLETTGPLVAYVLTLRNAQYVCTSIAGGHFPFCAQVWLDASDTAYICVKLTYSPGNKKVDVAGGYNQTKFAGYLLP